MKLAIINFEINSQNELLDLLIEKGYDITQATLSRDLKLLKASKTPTLDGKYKYVLPNYIETASVKNSPDISKVTGFLSLEFSGNLGVIKTVTAFSHSIALVIDAAGIYEIIGTIAGDDTILLVIREGISHDDVRFALKKKFPELKNMI
ncbi:MAG: hypothetical protein GY756_08890 [bacterium]|nr:hypothetical protein [bacterium]